MGVRWASLRCRCAALSVLTLTSLPDRALALGFSEERALGIPAESAPILWHRLPEVAFDGQSYVVAWLADRRNLVPFGGGSLFAARVDEQGTLLDPHGIFVSRDVESVRSARAPWGTLIVYVNGDGVLAARLNRQGQLADAVPLRLAEAGEDFPSPTAACSDSDCFVTWNSGQKMEGVALDGCGLPVTGTELSLAGGDRQMIYGGDAYLLIGHTRADGGSGQGMEALGVRRDGSISWGPRELPISTTSYRLAVAHGTQGYLAAWNEVRDGTSALLTLSLDDQGEAASAPRVLMQSTELNAIDLAWEVDHYRLTLQSTEALATLRLDAHGGPLDAAPPAEFTRPDGICGVSAPRAAVGDASSLVVWDWGSNAPDCQTPPPTAALFAHDAAAPGAPFRFDGSAARMGPPAIGTDGNGYVAAWYEERAGATGLYTQRLASDAMPLEAPVLTIEANPHPAPARGASVSFVGGHYLVGLAALDTTFDAWDEPGLVATVDASSGARGTPHDAATLGTAGNDGFLVVRNVVRQRGEDLETLSSVAVSRSDAEGQLIAPDPAWIDPTPSSPDVIGESDSNGIAGFDGQNFAMVWDHWMDVRTESPPSPTDPPGSSVITPSVTARQQSLLFMPFGPDAVPLLAAPVSLAGLAAFQPLTMTFGSGAYLLVMLSDQNLLSAIRVTPAGQVLDANPTTLSETPLATSESLERIFASFDGQDYLVAFNLPHPPDPPTGTFVPARNDLDLHVASIGVDGALRATEVVASGPQDELGGALASRVDGTALLGYQRFEPAPELVSMRAYTRLLGTSECSALTACTPSGCQGACCETGCSPAPGSLACEAAVCNKSCPAGSHCTSGLGCVPNRPEPPSGGCGCRSTRKAPIQVCPVLALVIALAGARRLRRQRALRRPVQDPDAAVSLQGSAR